jgi:hypothetical protein
VARSRSEAKRGVELGPIGNLSADAPQASPQELELVARLHQAHLDPSRRVTGFNFAAARAGPSWGRRGPAGGVPSNQHRPAPLRYRHFAHSGAFLAIGDLCATTKSLFKIR